MIILFALVYFYYVWLLAESIQGLKYLWDNFVMQIHYLQITIISEMWNSLLRTSWQFTLQGIQAPEGGKGTLLECGCGPLHRTFALRNLMLAVQKVTGPSSVKTSKKENWCQVTSVNPYWQKMCSCELLYSLGRHLGLTMQTFP